MEVTNYNFQVTLVRYSQRPYADTVIVYEVVDKGDPPQHSNIVKMFCTKFVKPASKKENDVDRHWAEYHYTFEETADKTYRYTVTEPSTE